MPFGYFGQFDSDDHGGSSHTKDGPLTALFVGYIFPAIILLFILANLVTGKAVLPANNLAGNLLDGLFQSVGWGWQFAGILTAKLGVAAALFAWFGLANDKRVEHWAEAVLLASVGMVVVGIALMVAGVFI